MKPGTGAVERGVQGAFSRLSKFKPLDAVFFSHAEAFYFDEIPFVYSFLYVPCSRGHIRENIAA